MMRKFTGEMNHRWCREREKPPRLSPPGTTEWTRNVSGFRTECLECSRNKKLVVTQVSAAARFQGNEEGNGRMSSIKDTHMTTLPG